MITDVTDTRPCPILVTGATGNQGGAVVRRLLADGTPVRALTRDPSQPDARRLAEQGVEVVAGDFRDQASVVCAMSGARGVFSVQNMLDGGPEQESADGMAVADAAEAAGVSLFVYSSVGGADRRTGIPHFESKWRIERHIAALELPVTILRPVFFIDNLTTPGSWGSVMWGALHGSRTRPVGPDDRPRRHRRDHGPRLRRSRRMDRPTGGDRRRRVTVGEAAAAYRRLKGRRPRYVPLPPSLIALGDRSAAAMFRWCRAEGYRADIPALRRVIPKLRDLAEGREKATPMKASLRP